MYSRSVLSWWDELCTPIKFFWRQSKLFDGFTPFGKTKDLFNPIQSLFNPRSLKEKWYAFDLRLIMRHIRSLPKIWSFIAGVQFLYGLHICISGMRCTCLPFNIFVLFPFCKEEWFVLLTFSLSIDVFFFSFFVYFFPGIWTRKNESGIYPLNPTALVVNESHAVHKVWEQTN